MKIEVTQKHIDKGIAQDCDYCPVALALKDAGCPRPVNDGWLLGLPVVVRYEVRPFIAAFDRGDPVKPFSFELEI